VADGRNAPKPSAQKAVIVTQAYRDRKIPADESQPLDEILGNAF
jgi:hypothetical protein